MAYDEAVCVGVDKNDPIVRCAKDEVDPHLAKAGARVSDLSGSRPMKGWLGPKRPIRRPGFSHWLASARTFAATPTKPAKRPAKRT